MARTFIGELIFRFQDQAAGKAKKSAQAISSSISEIERSAKRLAAADWGVGFQRQLDKLGVTGHQLDQVRGSWNALERDIKSRNLKGALRQSELAGWKTATISHFTAVRAQMASTEKRAQQLGRAMKDALRPGYVMLGGYTGTYLAGMAGRFAATGASKRERELFRQDMSGLGEDEKTLLNSRSRELGAKYSSLPISDIMELARVSRNLMGDANRGSSVLDSLVKTLVTLQSANGVDAATSQITSLLRAMDNLGVNKDGAKGIQQVNELLDLVVKASQVEGRDFEVADFLNFARRSKIAGPALSQEFLGSVGPALMQDLGADSAGNMIAMFFKNFVTGKVGKGTSKEDIGERTRMGLLGPDGKTAIDSTLAGSDPFAWVQKYLVPALQRDGVVLSDGTAVAKSISKLSGNTNVTGLLTRLVTQAEQIERSRSQYSQATGLAAADQARARDPFVAWRSFTSSLENLSSSMLPIQSIVTGLNSLSDGINVLAAAMDGSPDLAKAAGIAAGGLAAYGTVKIGSVVLQLATAGKNLNSAATKLERAAFGLSGGATGKPGKGGGKVSRLLKSAPGIGTALVAGGIAAEGIRENSPERHETYRLGFARRAPAAQQTRRSAEDASMEAYKRNIQDIAEYAEQWKFGEIPEEEVRKAKELIQTLSTPTNLQLNSSALDAAINKANQLKKSLGEVNSSMNGVSNRLGNAYADHGVSP